MTTTEKVEYEDPDLPQTWNISWSHAITAFPLMVAGIYIAGYTVANTHYARYELPGPGFLNARYLAAGLLWLLLTGLPVLGALIAVDYFASHWRAKKRGVAVGSLILFALGWAAIVYFGFRGLIVEGHSKSLWSYTGGAYLLGLLVIGYTVYQRSRPEWAFRSQRAFYYLSNFVSLTGALLAFGLSVYPFIGPQYGGAAVMRGIVALRPPLERRIANYILPDTVALVSQSQTFTYLTLCRRSPVPNVVGIPTEVLQSIEVLRDTVKKKDAVSLDDFLKSHHCPVTMEQQSTDPSRMRPGEPRRGCDGTPAPTNHKPPRSRPPSKSRPPCPRP